MAIMSILAVFGFSSYMNSIKAAKDARRKTDLQSIQKALETYYEDNQAYPIDAGGVLPDTGGALCYPLNDCTTATYLQDIPKDPYGSPYVYLSTDGSDYRLYACIENANDNGPGVNQNPGYGTDCSGGNGGLCDPCKFAITSTNTTP